MVCRGFLLILSCLIFGLVFGCCFAVAQNAPADSNQESVQPELTTTGVAPGDVVETIHGFCDKDLLIDRANSPSTPTSTEAARPDSTIGNGSSEPAPSGQHGPLFRDLVEIVAGLHSRRPIVTLGRLDPAEVFLRREADPWRPLLLVLETDPIDARQDVLALARLAVLASAVIWGTRTPSFDFWFYDSLSPR